MPQPVVRILTVENLISEVQRANDALRHFWCEQQLPEDLEVPVTMCLEEVLSNVIRHGCVPGQAYDIKVRYEVQDKPAGIEVEVTDDAPAFNPLTLPPPDLTLPIKQRKAGGMGVFLVRNMMEDVHYEHRDGRNCFRFRKHWPA